MRASGKTNAERLHSAHWALVPLVTGVLIGMAFSTVFLIRPHTAITNVYLELPSEREDVTARLNDLRQMLTHLDAPRPSEVEKLAEEVSVKDPVYYAVVMGQRHSSEQLKVLRDTWTGDIPRQRVEYFIPTEDQPQVADEGEWEDVHYGEIQGGPAAVRELQSLHSDFYIDVVLYVCKNKLNDTKWFVLAGDNVYIKSRELEEHLRHYETSPVGYLGRRSASVRGLANSACMRGPGTVLSHSVLTELCSKVETCSEDRESGEVGAVERCITTQLGHSCNSLEAEGAEHFLLVDSDVQGSLTEKKNGHKLESALTVYPISDAKMMYSIHQSVVGRKLNATQHEMHSLKWDLDRMTELLPHSDQSLHSSYKQHIDVVSTDDVVSWNLVNRDVLLSEDENVPTRSIPGVWRSELEAMMEKAVQYLNARDDTRHFYKRIVNAYWRVDPMVAIHYIIDFESSKPDQEDKSSVQINRHCITFTRTLNPPEVSPPLSLASSHQQVTITVCFTGEHLERLQQFMKRLEVVLEHDQRIHLVTVQMRSATEKQKARKSQNVVDAKAILSLYQTKYPSASFTLLESQALLSRSHSIAMVLRESRPSEVLFLADLDFDFDGGFLDRCRSLPIQGQQVYFPIVFSFTDPTFLASLDHTLMEGTVSQHTGHWLVPSYSAACLYAADLLALSTQSDLKGMLNEVDIVEVYRVLMERGYEVVRAPDKQLKRVYSMGRTCDLDLVGLTHDSCRIRGSSHESEYLQTQLSALLFDHEGVYSDNKY